MFADFGRLDQAGNRTDGRGSSFKMCLMYHTHDKRGDDGVHVPTSNRVTVIDIGNIAHIQGKDRTSIDAAKDAWRYMDRVRRDREAMRKAGKIRGQEVKKPVFSYFCSFHESEAPSMDEMRDALRGSLEQLGLTGCQYVCVAHNDGGAIHIHVIVNLIDAETMRVVPLQDNLAALKNWSMKWDIERGQSFSDELINEGAGECGLTRPDYIKLVVNNDIKGQRKARNGAQKDRKKDQESWTIPPQGNKEQRKERSREEHKARKNSNDNTAGKEAQAIKDHYKARYEQVKAINEAEKAAEMAEIDALIEERDRRISALYDEYAEARAKPSPGWWPTTRRILKAREDREWKALYRTIYKRQRAFDQAEADASGRLWNSIKLAASARGIIGSETGYLGVFVKVINDPNIRASLFAIHQKRAKEALRSAQAERFERITKTPNKATRDMAVRGLRREYAERIYAARGKHKITACVRAGRWEALKSDRANAWDKYGQKYNLAPAKVVRMGTAPYDHKPQNNKSFFIELDNGKTYWGHGLRLVAEGMELQIGEVVKITSKLDKTKPFERVNRKTGEKEQYFQRVFTIDRPQSGVLFSELSDHSKKMMKDRAKFTQREFARRAEKPMPPTWADFLAAHTDGRKPTFKKPLTPVRADFASAAGMDEKTILKAADTRKVRLERMGKAFAALAKEVSEPSAGRKQDRRSRNNPSPDRGKNPKKPNK